MQSFYIPVLLFIQLIFIVKYKILICYINQYFHPQIASAVSGVDTMLLEMMKDGAYFYKHDFGRNKRSRKHMKLSPDGVCLKWKAVGATEVVPTEAPGASSARGGVFRSSSFSRTTSISLADVSHIIYGPYTDTFAKKTAHDRVDPRWSCFSLVLRESRTVDFAAEDETSLLPWLLGLQQLIVYFSPNGSATNERWTLPKLHLQKLRLKVSGESDRTGQGPYDVVLSAVLDVATELQQSSEKATVLQAAWRRRNVQGKFQTAVQEMMEINGLIEDIEAREVDLKVKQDETALAIEKAMATSSFGEAPPKKPSDRDMADPKKMQEYMLQMGEYSARQQLKLFQVDEVVQANQQVSKELHELDTEKRKLQNYSDKLQFSVQEAKMATLSPEEAAKVMDIQKKLGVTPRGTIRGEGVRAVTLFKETQQTRLGIIFHQNTPEELSDIGSDATPRGGNEQKVVIPVIKVLDKSGIAGQVGNLFEGDQVLSVNGVAALSNIQAVQMLREATGQVVLAVKETPITRTPRGTAINPNMPQGGLRPLAQQ